MVGDSVPNRLMPSLAEVGEDRGLTVVSAAQGSCTPLGVQLDFGPENESGSRCTEVIEIQERAVVEYAPGVVIWWSRYEIADRIIDGEVVAPNDEQFWAAQEADLRRAVDRLTAGGARLVVVLTERPGIGMMSRDEATLAMPLIQRLIHGDEFRIRFNEMVLDLAEEDPRIATVDGDALFCSPGPGTGPGELCDDSVVGIGLMRYDGSHVNLDLFGRDVATALLDQVFEGGALPAN